MATGSRTKQFEMTVKKTMLWRPQEQQPGVVQGEEE